MKTSLFERLQIEIDKTAKKVEEVKIQLKAVEQNFLSIGFKAEVWLDDIFYDEKRADARLQYFLGFVPVGKPGIMVKTVIRDSASHNLIDSRITSILHITDGALLKEAIDRLYPLLQAIQQAAKDRKEKAFAINSEILEGLASEDLGRD